MAIKSCQSWTCKFFRCSLNTLSLIDRAVFAVCARPLWSPPWTQKHQGISTTSLLSFYCVWIALESRYSCKILHKIDRITNAGMVSAAAVPQLRGLLALHMILTASTSHWLINNDIVAHSSLKKWKMLLQQRRSSRLSSDVIIIMSNIIAVDTLNCPHRYYDYEHDTDSYSHYYN